MNQTYKPVMMWGGANTVPDAQNSMVYVAIAVTVIGASISAYSSYQQGQAAKATAQANADRADREARQQLLISRVQEAVAARQAEADRALAMSEAEAAAQNSQALRNEAEAQLAQSRENIKRRRDEAQRLAASQRGTYAASGVLDTTGTPLAVLAETAWNAEMDAQDQQYVTSIERQKKLFEADLTEAAGGQKRFAAQTQFELSKQASKVRSIASRLQLRNRLDQGEIDRWAGNMAAKNATTSAIGQGISALGWAGNMAAKK